MDVKHENADVAVDDDLESVEMDSDTSTSSSDDESEEEIEPELLNKIMALETDLQQNPRNYNSHLQYISLLRQTKLTERLRQARQSMRDIFPLTETVWNEWISDELDHVQSHADVEGIKSLYSQAVRDYLSVDLWASYLQLEQQQFDLSMQNRSKEGVASFRQLCEDAIIAAGLHMSEGSRIWAHYRCAPERITPAMAFPVPPPTQQLAHCCLGFIFYYCCF